jgi:two-component sensor histidine kinase
LPERLANHLPPLVVEIAVGVSVAVAFVILRMALVPLAGDRAPYAFVFLSIVIATVIGGWRGGLVAFAVGQPMAWSIIALRAPSIGSSPFAERFGGLVISTLSELIILLIIAQYQREVEQGARDGERHLDLLDQALREMDHRARNNYQTVLSLIQLQAAREKDEKANAALRQVADRITAISSATEHLAIRSEDLSTVRLRDHLCELCGQLERGLAQGEVRVECDVSDVLASADTAIHLAIIVNELVTNSLKHAFPDGRPGKVLVRSQVVAGGGGLELEVSDDGCGMKAKSTAAGTGLGRKLVDNFARHLGARLEVSSTIEGTRYRLLIPALV